MSSSSERVEQVLKLCATETGTSRSIEHIREYLRLVRELRIRQSDAVATYGSQLLQQRRRGIPDDEWWTIMEQVAEAALDVKALELAISTVSEIRKKFPNSQRALRITAMYYEAKGKFKEAEDVITKLLEDHPDSTLAMRRQVAIERTKGNLSKATELLRSYVDTFQTDREAWEELADLYVQAQMYPQAAFCYEELLLHSPQTVALYVQYADVLYTMGGSNVRTAHKYYAAAIKLSGGDNLRALYGVCSAAATLAAQKGKGHDDELAKAAAEVLQRRYLEENKAQLPLVKELLKVQGFA